MNSQNVSRAIRRIGFALVLCSSMLYQTTGCSMTDLLTTYGLSQLLSTLTGTTA